MKLDWGWVQRRFWEFRQGHSLGLSLVLGFISFIGLNYSTWIRDVPFLVRIFPHLWTFAIGFLPTYILSSILLGHFGFRKRQFHTDLAISTLENPYLYKSLPGKELLLSWPIARDTILLRMEMARVLNALTPELEARFNNHLRLIDKLMNGEVLKA